jgi:hypothetical protein
LRVGPVSEPLLKWAAAFHSSYMGRELSPALYRIPYRIVGVVFVIAGALAILGVISFRPQ